MAISFNTSWTHGTDSSVSDAATIPAGVLAGDVMVVGVTVFCEVSSGVSVAFSGGSAGAWTLVSMTSGVNPEVSTAGSTIWSFGFLYTKTAAAGDPGATLTVTSSGTGGAGVTWMNQVGAAYTGANTASPADVCFGGNAQGSQTATAPSGTTATANDWAVYIQLGGNGQSPTYSTGTLRSAQNTAANVSNALYDSNGSAGASGTSIGGGTWTGQTGPNNWFSMFTLGLAPAASSVAPLPLAIPGRTWSRRFKHRQQPQPSFQAPPQYPFPPATVPGKTWQRRFKHRQTYPYPAPAGTPIALADSGTGADTFSAGNVSVPPPALAGRTWLRQFKHRQAPVCTSTFSVALTDSGAGADTLSAGNVSTPLPAVAGKTWLRQYKHRQAPLYTSTFSEDFTDSGSGADSFAPGIATPYPFPPARPGQTWQRRFRHRQTCPYPTQISATPISLNDSGTGTDTLSAGNVSTPLPAVAGKTWLRQYKHRQQPLYTSTFSEDFSDSGSGADTLAPGVATAYPFPPATPGQTWQRQYKHRQQALYTSTFSVPLADTGAGTDTLTPGPVFSNPLPPAVPGRTWQRRFKHAQTYPYLPLQPGQIAVNLADSGAGADTFAASITITLPLTLRAGKTWLRRYKHQQLPLYTSTFSEDFTEPGSGSDTLGVAAAVPLADSGTGTDTLALSVVTAYPIPLPSIPGKTWGRRYKHRQQHLRPFQAPPPFTIGTLTATDTSLAVLTAAAAAGGSGGVLTATDQRTGGPS